jgi:hypothetical protein
MNWLASLADRVARERFVITRNWTEVPYLTRWRLVGSDGSSRAAFLHRFHDSDYDEMHDHPWPFVSVILAGGYWEETPGPGWANGSGPRVRRWYSPGRVLVRPANWVHRVTIPAGRDAWSLVIRGAKVRGWGFWCPRVGFVPWRTHQATMNATGSGCPA